MTETARANPQTDHKLGQQQDRYPNQPCPSPALPVVPAKQDWIAEQTGSECLLTGCRRSGRKGFGMEIFWWDSCWQSGKRWNRYGINEPGPWKQPREKEERESSALHLEDNRKSDVKNATQAEGIQQGQTIPSQVLLYWRVICSCVKMHKRSISLLGLWRMNSIAFAIIASNQLFPSSFSRPRRKKMNSAPIINLIVPTKRRIFPPSMISDSGHSLKHLWSYFA